MLDGAPETRCDWAVRRLRTAILTGELRPGTKLRAEELAQRWQISATPLREAFQRLSGVRLVEASPQRGVRVATFTLEDAADLYALRLRLEPAAFGESLEHGDAAHRAAIAAAHDRLRSATSLPEGMQAHLDFHAALIERCPSVWTLHVIRALAEHSQRYVLLGALEFFSGRGAAAEHEALRDAALSGDAKRAVATLDEHLRRRLDSVRAALASSSGLSPGAQE